MGDREKALERFEEYLDEYQNVKKALNEAVESDIPLEVVVDMACEMAHDLGKYLLKAVTPENGITATMLPVMDLVMRTVADTCHMAYLAADKALSESTGDSTPDQIEELFRHFCDEMEVEHDN